MRLDYRDRQFMFTAGSAAVIIVIGLLIIIPGYKQITQLDRTIDVKKQNISKMLQLEKQIKNIHRLNPGDNPSLSGSINILSFLDRMASTAGIQDRIVAANPDTVTLDGAPTEIVEIKMKGVHLKPLIDFLNNIEHGEHLLKIYKLHFNRRTTDPPVLDVVFLVGASGILNNGQ